MFAVMTTVPALPVPAQMALMLFGVVGLGLAAHENGWLKDRRVVGPALALLVAGLLTQTVTAATIYELKFYCESWFGYLDPYCW